MSRSGAPDLLQRFVRAMRGIKSSDAITLVAVSGGSDSMCLLDLTARAAKSLAIFPHVVHLDHGWRASSALDAAFVASQVQSLGLPFHAERAEGLRASEAAGRAARLSLFARIGQRVETSTVLLGHSADDQAETIVQKLLRGTGIDGLVGMQARTSLVIESAEITVLRPLLGIRRSELREYCSARSIPFRDDPSNEDPTFLRNRIRKEIMPVLEGVVPGAAMAISRMGQLIVADRDYIDSEADIAWMATVVEENGAFSLDRPVFRQLAVSLQRMILRRVGERFLGPTNDLTFERIEAARCAIESRAGGIVVQWPALTQIGLTGSRAYFDMER